MGYYVMVIGICFGQGIVKLCVMLYGVVFISILVIVIIKVVFVCRMFVVGQIMVLKEDIVVKRDNRGILFF